MAEKILRFHKGGTFKILFFSDFQETYDDFDPRTIAGVSAALDAEKPDLVFLTGDNVNGPAIKNESDLARYLGKMLSPIAERGIPFCHVMGNHDYDAAVSPTRQLELYHAIPGCLTASAKGVPGTTNFVLPVYSMSGDTVVSAVWGLDAGHSINEIREGLEKEALMPGLPHTAGIWNIIRFEQQAWYWNTSRALEEAAGHKVPGVMAFHVAPWEFEYMRLCKEALAPDGSTGEAYNLGALNSGIFATIVQRGDVKCVLSGHTHENTASALYCGIRMCSVGSAGYSAYGIDSLRGGRVVELNESQPEEITTRMVYFRDLI